MTNRYTVWQINFTNAQIDEVNRSAEMPEFYKTYLRTNLNPTEDAILDALHLYKRAMAVYANSLERVFDVGNGIMGDGERAYPAGPHHSVSVGDLVCDDEGFVYLCAPVGWELMAHIDMDRLHALETQS